MVPASRLIVDVIEKILAKAPELAKYVEIVDVCVNEVCEDDEVFCECTAWRKGVRGRVPTEVLERTAPKLSKNDVEALIAAGLTEAVIRPWPERQILSLILCRCETENIVVSGYVPYDESQFEWWYYRKKVIRCFDGELTVLVRARLEEIPSKELARCIENAIAAGAQYATDLLLDHIDRLEPSDARRLIEIARDSLPLTKLCELVDRGLISHEEALRIVEERARRVVGRLNRDAERSLEERRKSLESRRRALEELLARARRVVEELRSLLSGLGVEVRTEPPLESLRIEEETVTECLEYGYELTDGYGYRTLCLKTVPLSMPKLVADGREIDGVTIVAKARRRLSSSEFRKYLQTVKGRGMRFDPERREWYIALTVIGDSVTTVRRRVGAVIDEV